MKPATLFLLAATPFALAACDDGSDRIAQLERNLEAEKARIVELEKVDATAITAERDAVIQERDALQARIAELEAAPAAGADVDVTAITTERDAAIKERDALQARIVELEAASTAAAPADMTALTTERDALIAERDALKTELETVRAAPAAEGEIKTDPVFDTATVQKPLQSILVRMRDTQAGLERLEGEYGADEKLRAALFEIRRNLGRAGRDFRDLSRDAKIELQ